MESARAELIASDLTPLAVLKQLEVLCHYQSLVEEEDAPSLCEQFEKWKTSRQSIAGLLDHL